MPSVEERIKFERERARIEKELMTMSHDHAVEEETLRHKNTMEEWRIYQQILPPLNELLKLQKAVGRPAALTTFDAKSLKHLGEGLGRGIAKQDHADKEAAIKRNNR